MTDELKSLIEDAAKLLGYGALSFYTDGTPYYVTEKEVWDGVDTFNNVFNPLDPERGDLWKVAEAAELTIYFHLDEVWAGMLTSTPFTFTKGDYQSQALAVLRAASAVLKARGE